MSIELIQNWLVASQYYKKIAGFNPGDKPLIFLVEDSNYLVEKTTMVLKIYIFKDKSRNLQIVSPQLTELTFLKMMLISLWGNFVCRYQMK